MAAATVLGAVVRFVGLTGHLPQLLEPDELTTVGRAVGIVQGDVTPPMWDWPPGGAVLDAVLLSVADWVGVAVLEDLAVRMTLSRVLFALVGLGLVPATGWLAATVLGPRGRRVQVIGATLAATVIAVAYLPVRLSRHVHPEPLQALLVTLAVTALVAASRRSWGSLDRRASVLAGLAAATKYVGGIVLLVVTALTDRGSPSWWRTAGRVGALVMLALAAFLVGTSGAALWDARGLVNGLELQFLHQTGEHLGYEDTMPSVWFHATRSLPGSLGPTVALAALVGGVVWAWRGTREERLVVASAALLLVYPLVSSVQFPHYVLSAEPLLAVVAAGGVATLAQRWLAGDRRYAGWLALAALLAGLWLPLRGDLGLIRASRAPDTRELAATLVADLQEQGPVWAERYAVAGDTDRWLPTVSAAPSEVLACRCFVLVSSYQEQRFRRLPDRYASEVAAYDELQRAADVVATVEPTLALSFRWNLLPQWGVAGVPLRGELVTGPRVTVYDLREEPQ